MAYSIEKQFSIFEMMEAEPEPQAVDPNGFTQDQIDQLLRIGGNTAKHRLTIAAEFSKGKGIAYNADLMKRLYHGGNGVMVIKSGVSMCVWYAEEGIRISRSHTARYAKDFQLIPWAKAAERVAVLLIDGAFCTKEELRQAREHERRQIAEKLWYLTSDLSATGVQANHLPTIRGLRGGFPAETDLMTESLADPEYAKAMAEEVKAFCVAYRRDKHILRFHYHKPIQLLQALEDLALPRLPYFSQLTEIPESGAFITDDEIEASFGRGSGVCGGKDRIFNFFTADHSTQEKAEFLKKEYGIGGRSHALSGSSRSEESHNGEGIQLKKDGCKDVNMTWAKAADLISEMIRLKRYGHSKKEAIA